jgi:arsenite methyltransferase
MTSVSFVGIGLVASRFSEHCRVGRILCAAAFVIGLLSLAGCTPEMRARAYASDGRADWQQSDRVIATLGLESGDRVVDLGSGGGYFTFLLADAVGPSGRVYAIDVAEDMNERLARIAAERGYDQVETVLAAPDDAMIPNGGVDLVFTSNTYHHIENREAYFRKLSESLREGGRLAVIDYREEGFMQGLLGHSTDGSLIQTELESAGYELIAEHDFIEKQHFLIFAPE